MQNIFKSFFAALFIVAVSFPSFAADEVFNRVMAKKEINCGYFLWAPNIQKDPNTGKMSGLNYDEMEAIGKKLGLKINWALEVGPGDINAALNANKIDVMCATMWPSSVRYSNTTFTNRVPFYSLMFPIIRKDDKRFENGIVSVNKKEIKVTGIEGDVTADIANELSPKATKVFLGSTASPAEMLMQVASKKADVLFLDKGAVSEFSKTNPGMLRVVEKNGPVKLFGEHHMVKLGEHNLRDMLDMAMMQLTNDGYFEELSKKYAKEFNTTIYAPAKDFTK